MNILILEDRGSVSFYLEEALKSERHQVFSAFNVPDAQSYWESERIDCIIADLNMNPEGLSNEEAKKTSHGLLTGWIWLSSYVFSEHPEMRDLTILYTEYEEQFKGTVSSDKLRDICLVAKKGSASPAEELLEEVRRISRRIM